MGAIRTFSPVKLFAGILLSEPARIPQVEERLTSEFGPADCRSPEIPFAFTRYYRDEMGEPLTRVFFSFENLIEADRLADIKRWTNALEEEFAAGAAVRRPVNVDPGYIENAKAVLASTKNFYHRIYLRKGVFAEVTLHFKAGSCEFFPWTYPDYRSAEYQEFFLQIRRIYREQLRTMCVLRRE